jgi:hypothetical protein
MCNVQMAGIPAAARIAGASNACTLMTSGMLSAMRPNIVSMEAATSGAGLGCGPPGNTNAAAASEGTGTVISSTPDRVDPSAQ